MMSAWTSQVIYIPIYMYFSHIYVNIYTNEPCLIYTYICMYFSYIYLHIYTFLIMYDANMNEPCRIYI